MQLTKLKVTNFRNFSNCEITPSPGVNIFYGSNGSGKTNLLETAFILCLGRSQRGNTDMVLVKNGEESYRIEGQLINEDRKKEVAVSYLIRGRKQITINGVRSRLAELFENFSAVAIGPEDSEILAGSPSVRRLFMDLYISQYSQIYLEQLSNFNRVIAQKNAALKEQLDFSSYNSLLIQLGTELMTARNSFLRELQESASGYYQKIANKSSLLIQYQASALNGYSFDDKIVESAFQKRLDEVAEKERILKVSLVGPQRDEVQIMIDRLPARTHSSQGEWRSAAIAMKLAVYHLLKEKRKFSPLLLLDEVFAELDNDRTAALIESFADFDQLFLTTATEPPTGLQSTARKFFIKDGIVTES
jgi:DNA replication and repair protein RecF